MAGRNEEIAKLNVGLDFESQSFARELSNTKKQVRNLSRDFDVTSKSIEQAENKTEAMAQALQKGNRAFDATEKKLQMQTKQYDDLYKKTEKQRQKYDELSQELKKAEKALTDIANKGDKSSEAYKKQEKSVSDLKKALGNQVELVQKNSNKLQQYSTDIDKTTNELGKLKTSIGDLETSMTSMDGGAEALSRFKDVASDAGIDLSLLELGAKSAAIAIAAIFAKQVYDGAISYDNALTDLRISLGLTEDSAKDLLDTMKDITNGGYSIEGVSESVKYLEQRFNLTAEETENLAQSMDLLNKYGYDSADVTRFMTSAVNDWGMSHEQALDMIISGEQSGLNMSKDWLDTLVEYTPILSTLGLSGQEAFALIDEAVNATGMNTDQAADMVKEFFLTLTDGSTTSKDAFKDLGIDIDDLKKQIDNGSISSADGMKQVMKAIMNVGDETERARLLQEIFKGTVEYGSEGVVEAWANMQDSVNDTSGAMQEAKNAYEDSYSAMQQDLTTSWTELKQEIGRGVIPALTEVTKFFQEMVNGASYAPTAIGTGFQILGNQIGNAFDGAQGKVLEFYSSILNWNLKVAEKFGNKEKANSIKKDLDEVDRKHKEVSQRIGDREQEIDKLRKERDKAYDDAFLDIDTEPSKQKVIELTKAYSDIPKEVQTVLKANDDESKSKALSVYNLYEQLPPEVQTVIKADNYKALEGANTVQDILKNIPTEKLTSILTNINNSGSMTPEQLQSILDVLPEEERVKIETNVLGKEQVEQTKKDIDNIPKQSTSKVNVETGDSVQKAQSVKKEVDSVNGKVSTAIFKAETAQASKNVTGLKNNISDYDSKNTGKTKTTNFNSVTAQASKNVTGLKNNISSFVSSYAKTFTTTFNVVTKYSTQGSPTSASSGSKPKMGGSSISTPSIASTQQMSVPTSATTMTASALGSEATSNNFMVNPNIAGIKAFSTPILDLNPSSVLSGIDYNVNLLSDLENELKKVNNQLDILDSKADNAFGDEKIKYLNQENELFRQQQSLQNKIANNLKVQQNELKKYLSQKGYGFNIDGSIRSYQNSILDLEKQLQSLKSVEGDKNEGRIKELEKTKKFMEEYMDITIDKLPKANHEWSELENKINGTSESIAKLRKEQTELIKEAKLQEITDEFKDLDNELSKIDKLLKHSSGQERIQLLDKQLDLLKKQKAELEEQHRYLSSQASQLKGTLQGYGFKFDKDGDITNYSKQLEHLMKTNKDFDEIQDILKDYFDLQNNELPKVAESYIDLDNAIKDTLKKQLDVVKDIEDEITKVYKKEVDDRVDLINKELDERLKSLDGFKKAYNDAIKEADYQNDYDDQLKKIQDLQKEYDNLSGDNSLGNKKKLEELMNQIKEENKKLEEIVNNRIHDSVNDMYDEESNRLTESSEEAIKDLEDTFSESKIAELVAQALGSGVFTDIEGNVSSLEDALINFAEESGDLFGVLGGIIERELIGNLDQALDTFKDLDVVLNGLGVNSMRSFTIPNIDYSSERYNPSVTNPTSTTNNNSNTNTFNFNSSLINIEGNVDKDTVDDLKGLEDSMVRKITSEIMSKVDGR